MPERQLRELRASPRRNTSIAAQVVFNAGRTKLPCTIRNVSDGGAKLEVASVRDIPQTFDLVIAGQRPRPCRVVWRALKELGVAFV